ncbi:Co2+/Mg2+ efflux protein ApaG [Gayadomonas joobiniege]|uniref:Co2+/Mg2+ efflux protein ApaG n=1 Tax=Gayadomonas joobiniege TaxID=1234606 RepID=UPI0003739AF2|nr:Co2+/Mg2+ efflux protein ApaG [Gayadomonas joobiniege]
MNEELAKQVNVSTEVHYIDDQSDPEQNRYVFAYTISITNESEVATQLKSRAWVITDSNGKVSEISGEGVVGKQPVIAPGKTFVYTSGAVVETPVATMQGKYNMLDTEIGVGFEVDIPVFRLAQPNILN